MFYTKILEQFKKFVFIHLNYYFFLVCALKLFFFDELILMHLNALCTTKLVSMCISSVRTVINSDGRGYFPWCIKVSSQKFSNFIYTLTVLICNPFEIHNPLSPGTAKILSGEKCLNLILCARTRCGWESLESNVAADSQFWQIPFIIFPSPFKVNFEWINPHSITK